MLALNTILRKLTFTFLLAAACLFSANAQVPSANFTASPLAGCSPLVVNFSDQSTGSPTIWVWDFGNGATSTLQNPTTTYFSPGAYTVTLTVTNAAGSNTRTRTQYITVYEPPTVNFSATPTSGCFPLHPQFTDLSTPGVGNTNTTWLWDFGNATQSTQQNPIANYSTSGNFTVTLKVTNDKGCSKVVSRPNFIQVPNGVSAHFSHTLANSCHAPTNIFFVDSSTGPGTLSYNWDFGDGGNSGAQNPSHSYLSGGIFTVTLTTTSSAGCSDTETHTVTIINNRAIINAPDSACVNSNITFQDASSPTPLNVAWDFGDGTGSTLPDPVKSYAAVGIYNVQLISTYDICRDTAVKPIRIMPRPVANFTAPDTTKCQPPLTVSFQDQSAGAISWQWSFGDGGTSTLQNPVHTYNSYGIFSVKLVITSASGCTDTLIKPFVKIQRAIITVPALPARGCIPFTINPVAVVTALDNVTSWFWDFGDGFTSTSATPSHTYPVQGTYNIKVRITTSTGCTDSLIIPGAVHTGTHTTPNFTATPLTVCAFQPVQFTDLTPPPVNEWHWDFGDGVSSNLQNPLHEFSDTGKFTIKLVALNNGCPDSIVFLDYIYVLPPVAKFLFTNSCSNRLQYTFSDQSIGPVATWFWNFGDGVTSTLQNPVHTFPGLGTYNVTLTVTSGSCSHSVTHPVNVIDENPSFTADRVVACKISDVLFQPTNITSSHIVSYFWDFGNTDTVTTTAPQHVTTYGNSGYYTVTLVTTDINGCKDTITRNNYIRINGPIANFSATNVTGCVGLTTTFNDLSTPDGLNAITNWHWDFGDGSSQNFSAPPFRHVYSIPGTFSVHLRITDASGCVDSVVKFNIVSTSNPKADFLSYDSLTCPNARVQFYNTSSPPPADYVSFWDFGDGNINTTNNSPINYYALPGDYTVKLKITDSHGCSDSITRNLYIHVKNPVAGFTVNDSASSCTPFEVDFTNTSQYYIFSSWNFGNGGTSTLTNPTVYYTLPGTYIVTLYAISPGFCVDSTKKTITVYDTAGARVNYNPLSGCKPLSVNLNVLTSGNPGTFIWDYGDGTVDSSLVPNASHIYNVFGNYVPKVILKDPAGCLIPLTGPDTIRINGAEAKFGFDAHLFCDSGMVHFVDSTEFNDAITQYSWDFGDGTTSTQQSPAHQYARPGLYSVTLSVQTLSGCFDSLHLPDTIKVVQSPLIDITGDTSVCVNDAMLLNGVFLRSDTSATLWSWHFPNGNNAGGQNPGQETYITPGTFTVTTSAINSSGCTDTTATGIIIYPLPVATLPGTITMQAGFPVTINATYPSNVTNYLWAPSSTLSCINCPEPIANPKLNTNYTVIYVDSNGCKNSGLVTVIVICKNANVFMPNSFSPNSDGINDAFYPRGRGINRARVLRVFDRWGEVVFEAKDFPINDPAFGWDGKFKGNKPQPGVYVYQVEFYCDNGDVIRFEGNVALIL